MSELGTVAILKVANAAGVLTDVSEYLTDSGLPRSVDQVETTTFGKTKKVYIVGLEDGTISLSGNADATIDALLDGIRRLTVAWEYYPFGDASGDVKYAGDANISKYELTDSVAEAVKFSAEFQQTDDVTRTVVA